MANVAGKSVIITGGAGDIGGAAARRFIAAGARVLLVDIDQNKLQQVVADLDSERAGYCVADVTSEEDTRAYVAEAVSQHGGVDVLVANAGIVGMVAPLTEYDNAMFDRVMAINVRGPFLGIKHVFPVMTAGGGGSIIITSSVAGLSGTANVGAYVASKHAVIGLMRTAAKEGGAANIRVNTVNPAPVEGRMISSFESGLMPDDTEAVREGILADIPLQRYAQPEDVVNMMLFLAGEESRYLSGATYLVDGGMTG